MSFCRLAIECFYSYLISTSLLCSFFFFNIRFASRGSISIPCPTKYTKVLSRLQFETQTVTQCQTTKFVLTPFELMTLDTQFQRFLSRFPHSKVTSRPQAAFVVSLKWRLQNEGLTSEIKHSQSCSKDSQSRTSVPTDQFQLPFETTPNCILWQQSWTLATCPLLL